MHPDEQASTKIDLIPELKIMELGHQSVGQERLDSDLTAELLCRSRAALRLAELKPK